MEVFGSKAGPCVHGLGDSTAVLRDHRGEKGGASSLVPGKGVARGAMVMLRKLLDAPVPDAMAN